MDEMEFFTSWTFMLILAGLLCFLVLLVPMLALLVFFFVRRANRENREKE